MLTSTFIEDIFVEFYILVDRKNIPIHYIDQSACTSFFNSINADKTLTANQAKYILRILQKYKTSIRNTDKIIERMASIYNLQGLKGSSYTIKGKRRNVVKDTIDILVAQYYNLKKNYHNKRDEYLKRFGIK